MDVYVKAAVVQLNFALLYKCPIVQKNISLKERVLSCVILTCINFLTKLICIAVSKNCLSLFKISLDKFNSAIEQENCLPAAANKKPVKHCREHDTMIEIA